MWHARPPILPRIARGSLLLLALLASACSRGPLPTSGLLPAERTFYRTRSSFAGLFNKTRDTRLKSDGDFSLSIRPILKAVTATGDFVILDKLNVRNILLFDSSGTPKRHLGREGNRAGEYVFPHTLIYDAMNRLYYVYDGDLLRISTFADDGRFLRVFTVPLVLDSLLLTARHRLFGFSSTQAVPGRSRDSVFEISDQGVVLNSFAPQSKSYIPRSASEGGGVVELGGFLYSISPYEYRISVFTESGRRLLTRSFKPPHYVMPGRPPVPKPGDDEFSLLRTYHGQWSHIRQILDFDGRMIGVVFAEPGERRVFLGLFDRDLSPLATEIELPPYVGNLFVDRDRLLLMTNVSGADGKTVQPEITEYHLARASRPASL